MLSNFVLPVLPSQQKWWEEDEKTDHGLTDQEIDLGAAATLGAVGEANTGRDWLLLSPKQVGTEVQIFSGSKFTIGY